MPRAAASAWPGLLGALLLAPCVAGDRPQAFHVASIDFRADGQIDPGIAQACDVKHIVADAIERGPASQRKTTGLVLRIDRLARLPGNPPPRPSVAGTELGLTLLAVGARPMDQPFLCRRNTMLGSNDASHCARIAACSKTIAKQMTTWLSR